MRPTHSLSRHDNVFLKWNKLSNRILMWHIDRYEKWILQQKRGVIPSHGAKKNHENKYNSSIALRIFSEEMKIAHFCSDWYVCGKELLSKNKMKVLFWRTSLYMHLRNQRGMINSCTKRRRRKKSFLMRSLHMPNVYLLNGSDDDTQRWHIGECVRLRSGLSMFNLFQLCIDACVYQNH